MGLNHPSIPLAPTPGNPAQRLCLGCQKPIDGRGPRLRCDPCRVVYHREYDAKWKAANRPAINAYQKKWKAAKFRKCPDCSNAAEPNKMRCADCIAIQVRKVRLRINQRVFARQRQARAPRIAARLAERAKRLAAKAAALEADHKSRTIANAAFPYLVTARPETVDYLAINALVPQGIPGREDVAQEIALAILEGRHTLAAIQSDRRLLAAFTSAHRRDSFEANGYAVSLSQPRHDGRSWHDLLPDNPERVWAAP